MNLSCFSLFTKNVNKIVTNLLITFNVLIFGVMKSKRITLYLTILLPFQILFVNFISKYPHWIENYYSTGIYPVIARFLRFLLGWIPFSFGDLLGSFLISAIVYNLYTLIKDKFKNTISKVLKFTALLSTLYFCFYFFWGLNYFREPLSDNLNIKQATYTTEELVTTTKKIITKLNKYHVSITKNDTIIIDTPYTTAQIYKKAPEGFKILAKTHPQLIYKTLSVKNSLVSLMHMYTGTSGYLNPITGEAQVNSIIPKTGFPATTCHEMAHQIGWSAENDANFVGFLAATSNPDIYFKYAGYRMAFYYLIRDIKKRDPLVSKDLWKTVNKGVSKDFTASYKHWKQYENPIEPYIKKGYSSYLKANNQTKGIKSYSYVVDLFIAYDKEIGIISATD